MLITLEGCEGVGKSTALAFIQQYFIRQKADFVLTREPGGTALGEAIRQLLLNRKDEFISAETELLLLFAARAQHIAQVIQPALAAGKVVVSDRFTDSSFAYQGGGRQLPVQPIEFLAKWIQADLQPDLTLLFDAPVHTGLARMQGRKHKDRIETETVDFFERVREAYLARAAQYPNRFVVIDASQALTSVEKQIATALMTVFSKGASHA